MGIDTICRDCVWAKKEKGKQADCELNRLEKFKKNSPLCLSEDSSYYIIKDRYCNACRNSDWENRVIREGKDARTALYEEISLKIDALIYLDKNTEKQEIECTIRSLLDQKILPKNIVVLNKPAYMNGTELFFLLKDLLEDTPVKYSVETVLVDSDLWGEMNFGARRCPSQYFINLQAGTEIPHWLFYKINLYLNRDMERFSIIKDGGFNKLVISKLLFDYVGANKDELAIDKIKELAEACSQNHMIITYEDLDGSTNNSE